MSGIVRTEDQMVAKESAKLKMGGRDYDIRPLSVGESRKWRQQLGATVEETLGYLKATDQDKIIFSDGIKKALTEFPDKVTDLVFAYCKDWNREEVENTATDVELAEAFTIILKLAYPFVKHLGTLLAVASPPPKLL